jgi:LEA14-like dessication related protein
MKLERIFAFAGIFFIGKMAIDKLITMAYNRITYTFGRPSVDFSQLLMSPPTVRITLPMEVKNNNPLSVTVTRFDGELFYGNLKLSNISIPAPANLPANGTGTLYLTFNVQALQLINDVVSSITRTGSYTTLVNVLRLRGTLETSILRVPIETNISLV